MNKDIKFIINNDLKKAKYHRTVATGTLVGVAIFIIICFYTLFFVNF